MKYISLEELNSECVSHNREIVKKVMLKKGELPHLSGFSRALFQTGQVADKHSHDDMCEVFYVQSGKGLFLVNEKEFCLKKGVCIVVEPGEFHEIINSGDSELVLLYYGIIV